MTTLTATGENNRMTITEFLEARISDDERHARLLAETDRRPVLSLSATVNHPQRLLAECAAKRAVVTSYLSCVGAEGRVEGTKEFEVKLVAGGMVKGLELAVKYMASVYADHADYREEWAE